MADLLEELASSLGDAYAIERELGGGGMSRVFLAREMALERPVVIKVLPHDLGSSVAAQRFAQEVHSIATLQHPHVVPVLCAGHTPDGIAYYIMPFVRGETLRTRLERGRVPFVEARELMGDVAKALAAAHEAELVHRDVKPDNILLSGGAAVVTDFGIAQARHATTSACTDGRLTQVGTSLGTPAYMAPEQACGDAIDARTDVYSWGIVAYEMLCGHHPFAHATTGQQLMAAHIAEHPSPLSHAVKDTPAWFCRLVMSCLEKEPARRPADGTALVRAVEYGGAEPSSITSAMRRWFGAR